MRCGLRIGLQLSPVYSSPLGAEKHALEAETFEEGFNRLRPRVLDELRTYPI